MTCKSRGRKDDGANHGQFRQYYNLYYMLTTGGMSNPRLIIGAVLGLVTLVGGAVVTVGGAIAAFFLSR